ncbi:MAG: FAD:protein FMN transferase [Acidimicrobiia bacterium]|nr:FAD:protein FMN transferase [Acidimicrobiia bacterium]
MTLEVVSRVRFPMFGGEATVAVAEPRALARAQWVVQEQLDAIDKACSRFREDSELTALNAAAGRPARASELLREAIEVALRAAALTDGDVDPTVGEAVRVLGYDRDFGSISATGAAMVRLARVPGWRCVSLEDDGTVILPSGVQLDLGATAKAWAADVSARRAADAIGCGVLVGLGGDISVAEPAPEGGWTVGIADWHGATGSDIAATIRIYDGGVATSSTTVRRWRRGSRELHHLVDPRTGAPADNVWRTVTVAAGSCVDANTASTAAIIRGERAPEWLSAQALPARLVGSDGAVLRLCGWPSEETIGE